MIAPMIAVRTATKTLINILFCELLDSAIFIYKPSTLSNNLSNFLSLESLWFSTSFRILSIYWFICL